MDFISCYGNPFDSTFSLNTSFLTQLNANLTKVKRAADYLHKKFSFASVSFLQPPEI